MGFIPDRGVSDKKKEADTAVIAKKQTLNNTNTNRIKNTPSKKEKNSKKKIVSYYLETDLVEKIKSIADTKDMYYSALVTSALKNWIAKNN